MSSDAFVILRIDEASGSVLGRAAVLGEADGEVSPEDLSIETRTLGAGEFAEINREPSVLSVAKNMPMMLVKPFEAADEGTDASNADATWGLEAVGALSSHRTGAGVTVAILDTGINADHEAFQGKNIVQKDFTGEGDGDRNGHGTHCAGTVFGGEVQGQRIGVATGVEKVLIGKVLDKNGSGSTEQILNGLSWAAENGANVISMSLGLDFPGLVARLVDQGYLTEVATSIALEAYRQNVKLFESFANLVRARAAMFSKCIIVAAAGNESNRPQYEIAAAPPSAADGIMAVGAAGRTNSPTSDLTVAYFSNSGPAVAAPGVAVKSAAHSSKNGFRTLSGTSMATPHVAGVAALWIEDLKDGNPNFQIGQLEGNLTARALSTVFMVGVDPSDRGAGLVQAPSP